MKINFFSLLFALIASIGTIFASNTQVGGIWYNFNSYRQTAEVTYKGSMSNDYLNEYTGDIVIPDSVRYNNMTYKVTSIGGWAFQQCGITSIIIPNTVTSIGESAFSNSGLKTINLPDSITSIGKEAFFNCRFSAINVPTGLASISEYMFASCNRLTSIVIPENIKRINKGAFQDCGGLKLTMEANTPPSLGADVFKNCNCTIFVPCGQLETYKNTSGWSNYRNKIQYADVHITNIPFEYGVTEQCQIGCTDTIIITAIPNYGYHFTRWSDSNTENPRTILEPQQNSIVPEFSIDRSGYCGERDTLQWFYNVDSKTLSINGTGKLNENYYYGIEAPIEAQHLVIGEDVIEIGDSAFYGMSSAQSVTIGTSVVTIGNYAFKDLNNRMFKNLKLPAGLLTIGNSAFEGCAYLESIDFGSELESIGEKAFFGCTRVLSMICLAQITPNVGTYGLTSISSQAELYVLEDCVQKYRVDSNWSRFLIKEYVNPSEGFDDISSDDFAPRKAMIDGNVYILRGEKVYTLQGQEVR